MPAILYDVSKPDLNAVDGGDVLERGIIPGSSIGSNPG